MNDPNAKSTKNRWKNCFLPGHSRHVSSLSLKVTRELSEDRRERLAKSEDEWERRSMWGGRGQGEVIEALERDKQDMIVEGI